MDEGEAGNLLDVGAATPENKPASKEVKAPWLANQSKD